MPSTKAQLLLQKTNANDTEISINSEQDFQQGNITLAIQRWSHDIHRNVNVQDSLYNRSQAYILIKQYQVAIKDLDRLLSIQGKKASANIYIVRGIALTENNQLSAAVESFNQAEQLQASSLVYNNRAIAYKAQGKLDLALEDLKKSVNLSPIPPHKLNLASLQIQIGQNQQAIQSMTQALSEDSRLYPAYVIRGIGFYNTGSFKSALHDFVMALKIQPNQPEVFYFIGLTFNKLNRKLDATQNLLKSADLYLKNNQAHLYQQVLDKILELKL